MLRLLSVRNFTLIEALELEFEDGFSVITGETGAGKSLLVDVLELLTGGRAASGQVAPDARQAELSAVFDLPDSHPAASWLDDNELIGEGELILRRTLPASGASRAWINGTPVAIGQLRELGTHLVDIHGQHEHQRLMDPAAQLDWLDRQLEPGLPEAVRKAATRWREVRQELEALEAEAGDPQQTEFLRFQQRELQDLDLAPGEFAEMEQSHRRLAKMDEIQAAAARAGAALDGEDPPGARGQLNQAVQALEEAMGLDPQFEEIRGMVDEARINLDEATSALERQSRDLETDPESLARLDRRMGKAMDLARKHGIEPDELPACLERISERLEGMENFDQRREELDAALASARQDWNKAAGKLGQARRKAAGQLEKAITGHLDSLGMNEARVEIALEEDQESPVRDRGRERVEIRFSANPGQPPQPLRKVASGGELSRFSLALLAAGRKTESPRVRVFDEVDAGVGGETAHAVGRFLADAAGSGQAFAVTHLAQVAARADHQFRASKESADETTVTRVTRLDGESRTREIARMLGSSRSERSLEHAAELLAGAPDPA